MKIVVLAGGTSTERDVSLSSGKMIYNAIKSKNKETILLDVYFGYMGETEGIFEQKTDWAKCIIDVKEESPDINEIKKIREKEKEYFGPNVINICKQADMVFLALHGENGENGKIQAAFDLLGIKYTGTDYISAALAMDKSLTKEIFANHKISMPGYYIWNKETAADRKMIFPKVVKVADGGSSIGVYIVNNESEFMEALEKADGFSENVIVEEYIEGREFSVGVLEGKALPVIEIITKNGFYDYKNKYQAGCTTEICPAGVSEEKAKEMQRIAEKVFRVLRLKTYARVDFIMRKSDDVIFCLEANTLPGMTPTSLFPQEAKVAGIEYADLCMKIIELSLRN